MKKRILLLLFLLSYNLVACSSEKTNLNSSSDFIIENKSDVAESIEQSTSQDLLEIEQETANKTEDTKNLFCALGFPVLLPENPNWIKNVEYNQPNENRLEIHYYDDILGGDCIMLADKENISDLLTTTTFDESAEETWTGKTAFGQIIYVKVQHSIDDKIVIATWEYNHYKFAIQANILNDMTDTNSIPKVACYIIGNFET